MCVPTANATQIDDTSPQWMDLIVTAGMMAGAGPYGRCTILGHPSRQIQDTSPTSHGDEHGWK
jgi:hypothetical protein